MRNIGLRNIAFRNIALTLLALAALGASGCVVTTVEFDQQIYESCLFVSDCEPLANVCQNIVTDWPDGIRSENSICTYGCLDNLDCVNSANGNFGVCKDLGSGFLCYESCDFDSQCDPGFACGEGLCLPR